MEPQFRFCTSADGTRIAYATYGEGPPVLSSMLNLSVDAALTIPEARAFFDALTSRVTLALYDRRGMGASDRMTYEDSAEARDQDLAAVADALTWRQFSLFANNAAMLPYAVYARAHPERVTRLIWWNTVYAALIGAGTGGEHARTARAGGLELSNFRRRAVASYFPDGPVRMQREYGMAWKAASSPEAAARGADLIRTTVVDDLLSAVATQTLVLGRSGRPAERPTVIRMAGLLPNSELQFVPGNSGEPFPVHEPVVEAIFAFLGLDDRPPAQPTSGTAVILFTDIVSSTELTERMGDARFRDASRALDAGLRAAIRDAGGAAIDGKLLGDGVLATFPSAAQAIDGARRCLALSAASELGLHIGLHAGDVIREDNNVYGGAVNIASRICGLSAPGEILVSDVVRGMARSSAGVEFEDRGEQEMKGVGEPVRVYAVRVGGA
jgi:class 3 adenylate cyclase